MRALDLFRGAGGWSVACQHLGIEDHGVEIMPQANETALAAGHSLAFEDVWVPQWNGEYDGLIASPPCQTFSQAGKGKGRKALDTVLRAIEMGLFNWMHHLRDYANEVGDERTALVLTPLHYAATIRPEWIALEQVPTVLPVWEACATPLRNMGYSVWTGNLQAEQYGVPQTRKRAILIASRVKQVGMPEPTHSRYYPREWFRLDPDVKPWISMAEALGWGLRERPSPTVTGGGTETGGAEPIAKIVERWTTRPDWAYRRPSTTIVGTFKPEVVAAPGYRTTVSRQNAPDSVRVTVQEAGILQSFPADYPWQGAKTKQYLQVGNAIPPLLAEAILSGAIS